jgi:hypothetical protein
MFVILFLSLLALNSARVINKPLDYYELEPQIIGSNPKTWSPATIVIPSELFDPALDCSTCKIIVDAIETDACSKCPESDKCTQLVTAFGDPEKLCQLIKVCPKTSWLKKVFG